jgi:hypothetical protein
MAGLDRNFGKQPRTGSTAKGRFSPPDLAIIRGIGEVCFGAKPEACDIAMELPQSADSGHCPGVDRTGQIDPKQPFTERASYLLREEKERARLFYFTLPAARPYEGHSRTRI